MRTADGVAWRPRDLTLQKLACLKLQGTIASVCVSCGCCELLNVPGGSGEQGRHEFGPSASTVEGSRTDRHSLESWA